MKTKTPIHHLLDGAPLDQVKINFATPQDRSLYPFSIPLIANLKSITVPSQVTFFVGENGSGKSAILEAIALKAGFGPEGGSRNIHFKTSYENTYEGTELLAQSFTLSWRQKRTDGYFFRAESFFNIANYLDTMAHTGGQGPALTYAPYGGKSLHAQSHGESFLSFFSHRLGKGGFFILDEPEAALSPQRQLSLLVIINEMCQHPNTQFILATHSPLLLAYPGATIYSCDSNELTSLEYTSTSHYNITKHFLDNPAAYLRRLFTNERDVD